MLPLLKNHVKKYFVDEFAIESPSLIQSPRAFCFQEKSCICNIVSSINLN